MAANSRDETRGQRSSWLQDDDARLMRAEQTLIVSSRPCRLRWELSSPAPAEAAVSNGGQREGGTREVKVNARCCWLLDGHVPKPILPLAVVE